ncbi:hypothetical protein GXN78_23975 [Variovorax sp. WS11]|nr:hypothetical protein [Variovorax sp. WS11]
MAFEGMHRELLSHLQAKRAEQPLIGAWEKAWRDAQTSAGEPIPCPECFLERRMAKLDPLPSYGTFGQARCSSCGTVFLFPNG